MKTGRTLTELAQELDRQQAAKRDFITTAEILSVESNGNTKLRIGSEVMELRETAHDQLASKLEIPAKYYDRMRKESPELLDKNINHWLAKKDEKLLVRTLDNGVRAFLSDRYRPLDNADLAEAVLPVLTKLDLIIMSCEISEKRMYIKAVDKRITRDIPIGEELGKGSTRFNTLSPAITISNSEIGYGRLLVMASTLTEQCTNITSYRDRSVSKYHLGSKFEDTEDTYELLSDRTKSLSDAALWSQIGDVVAAAFDKQRFIELCDTIAEAAGQKIERDPIEVIELTAKKYSFVDSERVSVLQHLISGGDLSKYGLSAAVTRTAEDLTSYDRATEFEKIGGAIIELPKSDWMNIAA